MSIPSPAAVSLAVLSQALDAASHSERMAWLNKLSGRELSAMYVLAEGGAPLDTAHFHGPPGEVVIHHGQNSLLAFNSFQKRVVDNDGTLQGYNHQTMAWFTGPGHFTLAQDGDEVLFDYIQEPTEPFSDFPPLKSNTSGLSTFVYGHMIDRVRRVSQHTVIGQAFKSDKPMSAWFALIKEGE
jgi:hypothetical protein